MAVGVCVVCFGLALHGFNIPSQIRKFDEFDEEEPNTDNERE